MPHPANTEYLASTDARVKPPNYFIVVKNWGVADRHFAMKPVLGATRNYMVGLKGLRAISQKITPEEGKSSIGTLEFGLLDKNDRVTALLASAIRKKQVELWAGYDGIDESKYIQLTTNLVDDFSMAANLTEYIFKTADIQRSIKSKVFKPKVTSLTAQLNAGATAASVADASAFLAVVQPSLGTCGYLRIDDEIIKWTAKGSTSFTIARGQFGTVDAAHSAGAEVRELIVFQEHPVSIALKVILSTGAGTNGAYDTLPSHWALGMDAALVKVSSWESQAEDWLNFKSSDLTYGYQFRFLYDGEVEAKKFIEDEILKVLNAYAPVGADGSLSFKAFAPPVPFVDLPAFDEKVMKVKSMSGGLSALINIALFSYDHDLVQDAFLKNVEYSDGSSIAAHGLSDTFTVESRGIRSDLNGAEIVLDRWNRIKQRFSKPVPTIQVQAFYSKHLYEAGELINFSHARLPDLAEGSRGMTEKVLEIVNKGFDIMGGALHYDMMITGFGQRYALYGPDSLPAYGTATEEQKQRYGWYADDNGKVGGGTEEGYRYA